MAKIKVSIKNTQREIKVPTGTRLLVRRCCAAVLEEEAFKNSAEVSVSFVSNQEIKMLNKQYRGKNAVTDVLSFPLSDHGDYDCNNETEALILGDVVISLETAQRQALVYGHSFEREIGFLTVHSMLHLLGYDHETSALDAAKMREKEELILERLGISRNASFIKSDNNGIN